MPKTQIVQDEKIYNVDTDKGTVTPATSERISDLPFNVVGGAAQGALDILEGAVDRIFGK